ncbi:hypothetical protein [Anabaena lutea]|uniref:RcnB family protein n=1 Tax=Anabaena lutea FACHB-196 TaxID=2692881 RepID=A0ABR8FBN0_9NOST|nr:hypothetical protein [Anabaena lutea]MBD2566978.1 hypothetical protein [Anabaena lutea FACHB-196]
MLNQKRAILLLAAAAMVAPMFLAAPANASPRYNNRRVQQSRPVYQKVIKLRNGDYRLPNGEVISSRRVSRLRNPGYWRLPNGDIIVPSQEIVPARTVIRLRDGSIRLPNGIIVRI